MPSQVGVPRHNKVALMSRNSGTVDVLYAQLQCTLQSLIFFKDLGFRLC